MYALFAVSFGLIYNVTHIFHFAHGAVISAAGYFIYVLVSLLGWPIWLGIALAIPFAAALVPQSNCGFTAIAPARCSARRVFPHVRRPSHRRGGPLRRHFRSRSIPLKFLPLRAIHLGEVSLTTANISMLFAWSS